MIKALHILLTLIIPFCGLSQIELLPYQTTSIGTGAKVIGVGDLNNDGRDDVVVGTISSSDTTYSVKVLVFIQNGQGNLNPPIIYPYPTLSGSIASIAINDVNNDGLDDVIIGYGSHIGIYYQNTSGTLDPIQSIYSGEYVEGIESGDLNSDGLNDIAVSHWNELFIRVFYQTSNGFVDSTYAKPYSFKNQLEVADINSDGLDDVIFIGSITSQNISVMRQNYSGGLDSLVTYTPAWTFDGSLHGIAVGDLNLDGKNDIAATVPKNTPNSRVLLWIQDSGNGTLPNVPVEMDAYEIPSPIEIVDMNCDGRNEMIVANGWQKLSVYEMDSTNEFGAFELFDMPYGGAQYTPYGMAIGDINGDVKNDIVLADSKHGLVMLINDSDFGDVDTTGISFHQDTVSVTITLNSYYLTDSTVTYTEAYRIVQFDTFKVTKYSHTDTIKYDTTVITHVFRCEVTFDDTTTVYGMELIETNWRDTVLHASRIDSIFLLSNHVSLSDSQAVSIYPNPSHGSFEIKLIGIPNTRMTQLVVYNNLGQKLFSKSVELSENGACNIDLSAYPSGAYFVHIEFGNQKSITRSLMKM